jgi:DNA-binding response OmpR family regulator
VKDTIIPLAPREYLLLEYMALHPNIAIDRMELLSHVWGDTIDPMSNTVDVHIRYIRSKLGDDIARNLIHTIKGKGYMVCVDLPQNNDSH